MLRVLLNTLYFATALDVVRKDLEAVQVQPGGARIVVAHSSAPDLEEDLDRGVHASGPCIDPQSREFVMPHVGGPRPDPATEQLIAGASAVGSGLGYAGLHIAAHIVAGPLGNLAVTSIDRATRTASQHNLQVEIRDQAQGLAAFETLMREVRGLVRNDRLEALAGSLVAKARDVATTVQRIILTAPPEQVMFELAGVANTLELSRSDWIVAEGHSDAAERSFMTLLPAAALAEAHTAVVTMLSLFEAEAAAREAEAESELRSTEPGRRPLGGDRWASTLVDVSARYGKDLLAMKERALAWRLEQYEVRDSVEWEPCSGDPSQAEWELDKDTFEPPTDQHWTTRAWEMFIGVDDERLSASLCPARRCWLEDAYLCPEAPRDTLGSVRTYERFMFTMARETLFVPPNVKVPSCEKTATITPLLEARRTEIRHTLSAAMLRSLDRTLTEVLLPILHKQCPQLLETSVHADTHETALSACFRSVR